MSNKNVGETPRCHQKTLTVPAINLLTLSSRLVLLLCQCGEGSLNTFPLPAGITLSFVNKGHWKDTAEGFPSGFQSLTSQRSFCSTWLLHGRALVPSSQQLLPAPPSGAVLVGCLWRDNWWTAFPGHLRTDFHKFHHSNLSAVELATATLSPIRSGSRTCYSLTLSLLLITNPLLLQSPL